MASNIPRGFSTASGTVGDIVGAVANAPRQCWICRRRCGKCYHHLPPILSLALQREGSSPRSLDTSESVAESCVRHWAIPGEGRCTELASRKCSVSHECNILEPAFYLRWCSNDNDEAPEGFRKGGESYWARAASISAKFGKSAMSEDLQTRYQIQCNKLFPYFRCRQEWPLRQ